MVCVEAVGRVVVVVNAVEFDDVGVVEAQEDDEFFDEFPNA